MKKKLFLALTSALSFYFSNAQNAIPNAGFESWTSQGSYDDCAGWGTIDQPVSSACFCKGTAVKTSTAGEVHTGTYAMKLKTLSVFAQTAPGIAATGTINQTTQAIDGGVAYNLRPDSIVGWYRYTPAGTDTGSVEITLSRWNTGTNTRDVVAHAKFTKNTSVASYTRFSQPLVYSLSGAPDTMVVILLSSSSSAPVVNSVMFVDDLDLIFNPTMGIAHNNIENSLFSVYPNPNNTGCITIKSSSELGAIVIYNSLGDIVSQTKSNNTQDQVDISKLPAGIYTIQVQEKYSKLLKE
jgi:hypothetical protein